uniref:Uncharacterized protein n=1 Tax=Arundo donax TaxID=35708 RepID=A0A0A9T0V1_ARUDO
MMYGMIIYYKKGFQDCTPLQKKRIYLLQNF